MPVVLILLLLPLVEIALFIVIGGRIGLWPTLALIVLGALVGIAILRAHKARAVAVLAGGLRDVSPGTFLAQGAFQVVGGILLILPGFLGDAVGLLLLLPPVQHALLRWLRGRVEMRTMQVRAGHVRAGHLHTGAPGQRRAGGEIIEGEYEAQDEPRDPADPARRIDEPRDH